MTIRKELAEKKLGNVNKDYELTIEKLQRKLEEAHNQYKRKEKEFEETLDHLQTDIDSLENEKGEMKEKMKLLAKRAQAEASLTRSISGQLMSHSLNCQFNCSLFRIYHAVITVLARTKFTGSSARFPTTNAGN